MSKAEQNREFCIGIANSASHIRTRATANSLEDVAKSPLCRETENSTLLFLTKKNQADPSGSDS